MLYIIYTAQTNGGFPMDQIAGSQVEDTTSRGHHDLVLPDRLQSNRVEFPSPAVCSCGHSEHVPPLWTIQMYCQAKRPQKKVARHVSYNSQQVFGIFFEDIISYLDHP